MEVVERASTGAPLAGLFDHHLLILGLAFQVLTAVVGALLLTGFDRAVTAIAAAIRRQPRRAAVRSAWPLPRVIVRPTLLLAGAAGARGPPR
jgi:hypothetical protein